MMKYQCNETINNINKLQSLTNHSEWHSYKQLTLETHATTMVASRSKCQKRKRQLSLTLRLAKLIVLSFYLTAQCLNTGCILKAFLCHICV